MVENDEFLKAPSSKEAFSGTLVLSLFARLGLLDVEVGAAKVGFIVFKMREWLLGKDRPRGRINKVNGDDVNTYNKILRRMKQFAGTHWGFVAGKKNYIKIVWHAEVCFNSFVVGFGVFNLCASINL